MLGIKKCCNSTLARLHLGWTPISIKIWIYAIKYWLRSHEPNENEILKSAFLYSKNHDSLWKDGIQNILTITGSADIWEYHKFNVANGIKLQAKIIETKLIDIYYQNCQTELENSKKHSEYIELHTIERTKPKYLDMINDPRHRTTITKLRTHSHCLQTETGNYTKNIEDKRDYKCPNCDTGASETVSHFLWECPWGKLKRIRSLILEILPTKTRNHSKLTKIIINLDFQSEDQIIQRIYSLVHKMYKIREKAFKKPIPQNKPPIFTLFITTFFLAFFKNFYIFTE